MTFNLAHIADTAALVLAAYLLGCAIGYGARWAAYLGRGTRQVATELVTPAAEMPPIPEAAKRPVRARSNAARLAAASEGPPLAPAHSTATMGAARARRSRAVKADPRPAPLSAPRDGAADNLKQIKGIGPKIEASLNGLGIYHLDQIAGWTSANVDWVDAQLTFKGRIRRERWVEQAAELLRVKA